MKSRFQLLLRLFRDRFLENDTVSPGGGFQTNIYQMLGVLIAVPVIAGFFVMPEFLALSLRPTSAQTEWALRSLRLWFPAYSFGVAGFASLFYWDSLFPDRRDFLILVPFPIQLRELLAAKLTADDDSPNSEEPRGPMTLARRLEESCGYQVQWSKEH